VTKGKNTIESLCGYLLKLKFEIKGKKDKTVAECTQNLYDTPSFVDCLFLTKKKIGFKIKTIQKNSRITAGHLKKDAKNYSLYNRACRTD